MVSWKGHKLSLTFPCLKGKSSGIGVWIKFSECGKAASIWLVPRGILWESHSLIPKKQVSPGPQHLHSHSHHAHSGAGKLSDRYLSVPPKREQGCILRTSFLWKIPQRFFRSREYLPHLFIWSLTADILNISLQWKSSKCYFFHKISMVIAEKKEATALISSTKSSLLPRFFLGWRFFFR